MNAATIFGLTNSDSKFTQDLISHQLEPIINNIIGYKTFWDIGLPKGVAEFLVSGSAYSQIPVNKLDVSVSVGHISKELSIFGNRIWTESGIGQAQVFNKIAINYTNAFGGRDYAKNPLGKGYYPDNSPGRPLPNIELSQQLIVAKNDTPEIAGFEPYLPTWPQRNFSGNFDTTTSIVKLEDEVLPIHLNSAPSDQRFSGFFYGDEKIEIKNMHPKRPVINSALPELRFRAFAVQKNTNSSDTFVEMVTQADTLWLLPNMECGILVFRATCPISNIDTDDIKYVYSVMENLKESPKPMEYYMRHVLTINQTDAGGQISLNEKVVTDKVTDAVSADSRLANETINLAEADNSQNKQSKSFNVEELILELIRDAQKSTLPDRIGLSEQYKEVLTKINEMVVQLKMTEEETKEFMEDRKKAGLPACPSEEEVIDSFKEVWEQDPKMEASLREKMQALKDFRLKMLERIYRHTEIKS